MKVPPQLPNAAGKVLKLNKSLYGLKQAGREWNKLFTNVLTQFGFIQCPDEECLLVYSKRHVYIAIAIHVDDIAGITNDSNEIKRLLNYLNRRFKTKYLGEIQHYLNIKISKDKDHTYLSQASYFTEITRKFGFNDSNPKYTPMETNFKIPELENYTNDITEYQSRIGSVMYATTHTRPDLSFTNCYLSRYLHAPPKAAFDATKRLLQYINFTKNYGLKYSGKLTHGTKLTITGYTDSDWAGNAIDRSSTGGYIFYINNNPITYRSYKQRSTAKSATEAEYITLSEATSELIWIKKILNHLQMGYHTPTLHIDNEGARKLSLNNTITNQTKHIQTHYHFFRKYVATKQIIIKRVPTQDNVADIFTKALPGPTFTKHRNALNLQPPGK